MAIVRKHELISVISQAFENVKKTNHVFDQHITRFMPKQSCANEVLLRILHKQKPNLLKENNLNDKEISSFLNLCADIFSIPFELSLRNGVKIHGSGSTKVKQFHPAIQLNLLAKDQLDIVLDDLVSTFMLTSVLFLIIRIGIY